MSFQERPGDSPHPRVPPQTPSRPSSHDPWARCGLSASPSTQQATQSRGQESTCGAWTADGSPRSQAGLGEKGLQHHWRFSCSLPWPKPLAAPRPWGVITEATSFGSCPATCPAALQGSVDPALKPSLAFAASYLQGRGGGDHIGSTSPPPV